MTIPKRRSPLSPNTVLSFENTEIAFAAKSDRELNRAYLLFKAIGIKPLVILGPPFIDLSLKLRLPIKGLIRSTIFAHFCGGETIEDCEATINHLHKFNIGTILDYSVEGKETEKDFENCVNETIATIKRAKGDKAIPFTVFKVTGLASFSLLEKVNTGMFLSEYEAKEWLKVIDRVDRICKAANQANVPVFIDAEESWIQKAIDGLAEDMMKKYNSNKAIVYNTVQMYRTDRLSYLRHHTIIAKEKGFKTGIKLVRGAYMEKERRRAERSDYPSPIQPNKAACDRDYNQALRLCIDNRDYVSLCSGTHNEESSLLLVKLMKEAGMAPSDERVCFSQLLGMSDHISYNLASNGYNVAKYVPYGPVTAVLPYLFRRAAENTSIAGQTSRELTLLEKERKRRRSKK